MKVLVTGANGFLANNVIRELNRRVIGVKALIRPDADVRSLSGTDSEIFRGDFSRFESALEAIKDCNVIMHIAADTSQYYSDKEYNVKCNVDGTRNLLDASLKSGVERFIFVSTANTFAHGTRDNPGDETKPFKFPFTKSGYAISKALAQELVQYYCSEKGLPAIIMNPAFMLGPWDYKPGSGRIITMMYHRKVIPVPPGGKNFIHVKDAAYAICNAITQGIPGDCYLLANENLTYSDFYRRMEKVSGRRYYQIHLSNRMMIAAGRLAKIASYAGIETELTLNNARILCEENYFSGTKAVKKLGLPQTPVDYAILDAIEWFGRNGYF